MPLFRKLSLVLFPILVLTSCGSSPNSLTLGKAAVSGAFHGGQQPIADISIQLYAVGAGGDGTSATPLFFPAITSTAYGNFTFPTYTCPSASALTYLVGTGGDPGLGAENPQIALMAVLGPCGSISSLPFISVNELTTVAAVYALAPFMTSYSSVASGASDSAALATAFTTASEIANSATGATPGPLPAGVSVPVNQVRTVANIVASCINSGGGVSGDKSPCGQFFSLTLPEYVISPTDTIGALLNLALNPTFNTPTLWGMSSATSPYQPGDTTIPPNLAITLTYANALVVSPSAALAFPATPLNSTSPTETVTVYNPNSSAISISSSSVSSGFSFPQPDSCSSAPLAPYASCSFYVAYTPTTIGTQTGTFNLQSNAGNSSITLPLSGTSPQLTATTNNAATPNAVVFNSLVVGAPESAGNQVGLLLTNNSKTSTITISGMAVSGANPGDFPYTNNCGATLAPGQGCYVVLNFVPTALGTRAANLVVMYAGATAPVVVSLSGTGIANPATLSSSTLVPYVFGPYNANATYVRNTEPITFTGRTLPADATGTLTFSIDGVAVHTSTLVPQTFSDYTAIGNSITASVFLATPAERYQGIIASALNLNLNYDATIGMSACDLMTNYVAPLGLGLQTTSHPLYSVLVGSSDIQDFGVGTGEQYFQHCHQAMLAWLGTPAASKVLPGDPGATIQSGTWTTASAYGQCCSNVLSNTSGSGDLRFTLATTGNAAYLWYEITVADPGTFTVSVDGGPPSAPIATPFPANGSAFNIPGSFALLRLPVAAGTHTFDIVPQSGTVGVLGMGSMPSTGQKTTLLVGDVPNQLASNNNAAAIAEYTADIRADIALLTPDGLDLRFVPTQNYMFGTPAELMDNLHPNQFGMTEVAAAFLAAVTPSTPVADTVTVAAASYQTSSIPLGSHAVSINYSGDAKYAPAATGAFTMVLYDPTSTVSVTSDAATYSNQSPVTLTAYVPSANANGQVTFFDVTGSTPVQLGSAWVLGGPNTATLVVPSLSPGQHTLMVQYAGDVHFNGSSSPTISITVAGS